MKRFLNITVAIAFFAPLCAIAQKLPNKQEGSLRAPANLKIDGKANEWTFKAYNNATDVFYAIAHDDNNIYFAIKAEDLAIVRKILSAGITVTLSKSGKNSEIEASSITYPRFDFKNKPDVTLSLKGLQQGTADSIVMVNNKKFASQSKFIRVNGFKSLDTLISVYNADGINVGAAFDKEMSYVYELSVSRSLISALINTDDKLFYNVKLGALKLDDMPGVQIKRDAGGTITSVMVDRANLPPMSIGAQVATDFSGEYILSR